MPSILLNASTWRPLRGEETGMSRQMQIAHIDRAIAQAPDRSLRDGASTVCMAFNTVCGTMLPNAGHEPVPRTFRKVAITIQVFLEKAVFRPSASDQIGR